MAHKEPCKEGGSIGGCHYHYWNNGPDNPSMLPEAPVMAIDRSSPSHLSPTNPNSLPKLMGGLNGFGAGRPLVGRGREAPGHNG